MKNIIVGTAGHVDHGKTWLIKALTGMDTDRLKEEKKRGITIENGFADFEINLCLDWIVYILILITEYPLRLIISDRHRYPFGHCPGSFLLCQEAGHARNVVADNILQFRAKLSLNQNIARVKQPFDHLPLAILGYYLTLYRNKNLRDLIL